MPPRRLPSAVSLAFLVTVLITGGPSAADAQTIGTFAWQIAPFCNVVRFAVTVDGPAFRLTGFDDQCGGAQLPAAGAATPRSDGQYGLSFYVVTPTGLVSHVTAVLNPTSISGPWSDAAGGAGTLVFNPATPAAGAPRPAPLLSSVALANNAVTTAKLAEGAVDSARIADGTVGTADLANSSVTGAKLVVPLSVSAASPSGLLSVSNTGTGNGVEGVSTSNFGVRGATSALSGAGVIGDNAGGGEAIVGRSSGIVAGAGAVVGRNDGIGSGVHGFSATAAGIGVRGRAGINSGTGVAGQFENVNAANTSDVVVIMSSGSGDLIQASQSGSVKFRVTAAGAVQGDGPYSSPAADVAEFIDTTDVLTPGDVVEIDVEHAGQFRRATSAFSPVVSGVVTTEPGVLLNARLNRRETTDGPALAIGGRVPVKVSAENGAVALGDLLVSSSTPGHAMKAPGTPAPGTVIGKALGVLASGTGVIEMLVMLR